MRPLTHPLHLTHCLVTAPPCRSYGGYLGVKYVLAARPDLAATLLPRALPLLKQGLQVSGSWGRLAVLPAPP